MRDENYNEGRMDCQSDRGITCSGFRSLQEWQITQYCKAVDENKWYMSERRGSEVSWREAERDFMEHGYFGLARQWREQYCQTICRFGHHCRLGDKFVSAA
ncbi:MAG: hypothetical protein JXR25_10345 [Pontiellaceae bacterium]|nr:hypothetical protein [Pontiellaceae bacterium]MBN2785218.1 hypothetical protein [Pontiellaceae bacterium]